MSYYKKLKIAFFATMILVAWIVLAIWLISGFDKSFTWNIIVGVYMIIFTIIAGIITMIHFGNR